MSVINSLIEYSGFSEVVSYPFRISVLGKSGLIIEGVKRILSYSETEIAVEIKKGYIVLSGENLQIKKFGERETAIKGTVKEIKIN